MAKFALNLNKLMKFYNDQKHKNDPLSQLEDNIDQLNEQASNNLSKMIG